MVKTVGGLVEVRAVKPEYASNYQDDACCWVYEVWDTQSRLAYVGIADQFERRWIQHQRNSWWLGEIDIWYVRLEGFNSRWEARQVEAAVINEQSPVYNTNPESGSYRAYRRWLDSPAHATDDTRLRPVAKRQFVPFRDLAEVG